MNVTSALQYNFTRLLASVSLLHVPIVKCFVVVKIAIGCFGARSKIVGSRWMQQFDLFRSFYCVHDLIAIYFWPAHAFVHLPTSIYATVIINIKEQQSLFPTSMREESSITHVSVSIYHHIAVN